MADTEYVTIAHQDDIYEAAYTEEILKIADQKDTEARKTLLLFSDYRELIDDRKYSDQESEDKRILLGPLKNEKKQGRRWRKQAVLRFGNAICCPAVTYHKTVICEYLRQEKKSRFISETFPKQSGLADLGMVEQERRRIRIYSEVPDGTPNP